MGGGQDCISALGNRATGLFWDNIGTDSHSGKPKALKVQLVGRTDTFEVFPEVKKKRHKGRWSGGGFQMDLGKPGL